MTRAAPVAESRQLAFVRVRLGGRVRARQVYTRVAVAAKAGTSSAYNYYSGSWALMTLMLMTGNLTPL